MGLEDAKANGDVPYQEDIKKGKRKSESRKEKEKHETGIVENAKKRIRTGSKTQDGNEDNEPMSASRRAGIKHRSLHKAIERDLREKLATSFKDNAKLRETNEHLRLEIERYRKERGDVLTLIQQQFNGKSKGIVPFGGSEHSSSVSNNVLSSNNELIPTAVATYPLSARSDDALSTFEQEMTTAKETVPPRVQSAAISSTSASMLNSPASVDGAVQKNLVGSQPWQVLPPQAGVPNNGSHLVTGSPNRRVHEVISSALPNNPYLGCSLSARLPAGITAALTDYRLQKSNPFTNSLNSKS